MTVVAARMNPMWMPIAALLTLLLAGCDQTQLRDTVPSREEARQLRETATDDPQTAETSVKPADVDAPDTGEGTWGNLTGRFVYGGDAGEPTKINVTKDKDYCGEFDLRDESIVVGADGGLADVILWLRTEDITPHEEYAATADGTVILDNSKCRFEPPVALVRVGQTLRINNSDPKPHNSQVLFASNSQINPHINPGDHVEVKPTKQERLPVPVQCSIHPWMKARVVVKDTPYMAVTGDDGRFEITNLPAGRELTFQAYHRQSGYLSDVTIDGGNPGWKRGRFSIVIQPGDNDLTEVKVDPQAFKG